MGIVIRHYKYPGMKQPIAAYKDPYIEPTMSGMKYLPQTYGKFSR